MSDLSVLWRESAGEVFSAPPLEGVHKTELAIVGGGFTGCAAALEAAGQGADVTLLEAETIGHGGSGRNVGLVNAGLWLPPDAVAETLGASAGERLNRILAAAPDEVFGLIDRHRIACEPVRNGTLHLAHAPRGVSDLRKRHAQMVARGAPVTLLDGQEACDRTGTDRFHGALHDARAGTLQPLAYARGLARAAAGNGAKIFENSRVEGIFEQNGEWCLRTAGGTLTASRLLLATNAYHRALGPVDPPDVPVVNYFQLATEPLGANLAGDVLPGGEGCWDTGLIMSSLRRDATGRVILGGMGDADALGIQAGWARRKLERLFPRLADAAITHAWAGKISMTEDHLPRIMRIGEGGYAVFGYSGRGIAPGTVFGQAAARALLDGDEADLPIGSVGAHHERLPGLRTRFFETGARLVHMISERR
ncbi:FAD-dependent oxidoreductase [Roseovarius sp. TE539]|uniref:NAD(P)/FAD-dependent oxidoreductase n=1 Tax=Roseovarius sp. TE539 TaxID=2249812 RepID=UPI000DDC4B09|nr:FAD-binding oxidoreductase [Roseovarius sp. TE539]RBI70837.1 FAD-dependent oxidoreductase [Roseovarius sp. TE539]